VKIVDDGDMPAFPSAYGTTNGNDGLTIRDYFAGQALAGLCANLEFIADAEMTFVDIARKAFNQADAMITARSGHGRPTGEA
jgi:hypothetical protein